MDFPPALEEFDSVCWKVRVGSPVSCVLCQSEIICLSSIEVNWSIFYYSEPWKETKPWGRHAVGRVSINSQTSASFTLRCAIFRRHLERWRGWNAPAKWMQSHFQPKFPTVHFLNALSSKKECISSQISRKLSCQFQLCLTKPINNVEPFLPMHIIMNDAVTHFKLYAEDFLRWWMTAPTTKEAMRRRTNEGANGERSISQVHSVFPTREGG